MGKICGFVGVSDKVEALLCHAFLPSLVCSVTHVLCVCVRVGAVCVVSVQRLPSKDKEMWLLWKELSSLCVSVHMRDIIAPVSSSCRVFWIRVAALERAFECVRECAHA